MIWELSVALRYVATKQKDRFISIINTFSVAGIALGVATLIVVMSVMNGYEKELISKILSFNSHITLSNLDQDSATRINNQIKAIPEVASSFIITETQAMISSDFGVSGSLIKGVDDEYMKNPPANVSFTWSSESGGIILGAELARTLNVNVNDQVKVISSKFTESIIGPIPNIITLPVTGIIDLGIHEYNASFAMMKLNDIEKLYNDDSTEDDDINATNTTISHEEHSSTASAQDNTAQLSQYNDSESQQQNHAEDAAYNPDEDYDAEIPIKIEIRLNDHDDLANIKNSIAKLALNEPQLQIMDWTQANKSLSNALKVERNVMFLILSLIIMIAVFNIISGLVILVKDKSKGIAVMKTMGASKGSIVKIFVFAGFSIGALGTILGALIGATISLNIDNIRLTVEKISGTKMFDPVVYFLTSLPSDLSWHQVVSVVTMSLCFSLIATIYPAMKISKSSPISVLRYE